MGKDESLGKSSVSSMILVPEFFVILGIVVFLGLSFVSWLLSTRLPRPLPFMFQGAAAAGLGVLLVSQGVTNNGPIISGTISPTRVWISILYLTAAVSSLVGLNLHIVTVHHETSQISTLSGFVTGPTLLISAVLVFTFLETGGQASLEPATILVLAVLGFAISLGLSSFLHEALKHSSISHAKRTLTPTIPTPQSTTPLKMPLPTFTSTKTEDGWETAPRKQDDER